MTSDWPQTTLGDRFPLVYGKGLRAKDRNRQGDVDVFGSNGPFDRHDAPLTAGPTVVVGRKGSVGEVHFSKEACWVGDTAFFVEEGPDYDIRYVFYLMRWLPLDDMNTDAAVPGLNRKNAHRLTIPDVPLVEQRAIAEVLGSLDDAIEANSRTQRTIRQSAVAVAIEAEAASAPARVGEVGTLVRNTVSQNQLKGRLWWHYSIPALDAGERPLREAGDDIRSGKFAVPDSAVLVSKLNPTWHRVWPVGRSIEENSVCSTEFMPVVPREGLGQGALWAALLSPTLQSQMLERVTGSTGSHQRVRPEDLLDCLVAGPWALSRYAELLDGLLEEHLRSLKEADHLRMLRDVLLPELLSGRLRVDHPERLLEGVA